MSLLKNYWPRSTRGFMLTPCAIFSHVMLQHMTGGAYQFQIVALIVLTIAILVVNFKNIRFNRPRASFALTYQLTHSMTYAFRGLPLEWAVIPSRIVGIGPALRKNMTIGVLQPANYSFMLMFPAPERITFSPEASVSTFERAKSKLTVKSCPLFDPRGSHIELLMARLTGDVTSFALSLYSCGIALRRAVAKGAFLVVEVMFWNLKRFAARFASKSNFPHEVMIR